MYTAMLTVENIVDGTDHDIWSVNVEEEYHEEKAGSRATAPTGTGRDAPVLPPSGHRGRAQDRVRLSHATHRTQRDGRPGFPCEPAAGQPLSTRRTSRSCFSLWNGSLESPDHQENPAGRRVGRTASAARLFDRPGLETGDRGSRGDDQQRHGRHLEPRVAEEGRAARPPWRAAEQHQEQRIGSPTQGQPHEPDQPHDGDHGIDDVGHPGQPEHGVPDIHLSLRRTAAPAHPSWSRLNM